MTQEDKPIAIILPNWNPNEPRFIVEDAHDELADDRAFKNGKCVYNQRLGVVYTVEYIVDALNELGDEIDKLKEENEQLKQYKLYEDNKRLQTIIADLKEENEQLRILLKERQYKKDTALYDLVNSLTVENRELRQELNRFQVSLNYWQNLYQELYEKKG